MSKTPGRKKSKKVRMKGVPFKPSKWSGSGWFDTGYTLGGHDIFVNTKDVAEVVISAKDLLVWVQRYIYGTGDINWVSKEDGTDFI